MGEATKELASEAAQREGDPDRAHKRFLAVLTALVVAALWIRPMFSSLWLDELGTWWVVKDRFSDAVERAFTYQGQPPLYYSIAWLARAIGGHSEFVLRLPS